MNPRPCPHRAAFDAIDRMVSAIPRCDRARDVEGFLDAKSAVRGALRRLMLDVQHASASGPVEPLVAGVRGRSVTVIPTRRPRRP